MKEKNVVTTAEAYGLSVETTLIPGNEPAYRVYKGAHQIFIGTEDAVRAFLAEYLRERGAVRGVGKRPRERPPRPRVREQADAGLQPFDRLRIGQVAEQRVREFDRRCQAMRAFVVRDRERRLVCRQRRRGGRRRPARREIPAPEGQIQGTDSAVHLDRRRRSGIDHQRRARQQALPRDVQGAGRAQLWGLRSRQPGVRHGQRDDEVLASGRAQKPQDHVQRGRRERRHGRPRLGRG